jgi:hypothetical protein
MVLNRRKKEFIGALSTDAGRLILKYLQEDELGHSVLQKKSEYTHYFLGRKELVEELIRTSKLTDRDLDQIQTINTYEE